jgi:hypothetical protein
MYVYKHTIGNSRKGVIMCAKGITTNASNFQAPQKLVNVKNIAKVMFA